MMGKPVLAAINAADPCNEGRINAAMGYTPKTLRQVLQENLKKIERYGVRLSLAEDLAEEALHILEAAKQAVEPGSVPAKRSLISEKTIRKAAKEEEKRIIVPPGSLITPLARDVARELRVEIIET